MKISNNTILITGGTSGIGLELAKQLIAAKNQVIVTGRDTAKLAAARQAVPGLHAIQSDVSSPEGIRALYAQVTREFPNLNVIVNNAGIMRKINLHNTNMSLEDLPREVNTNLVGTMQMVQQFLPHLKAQPQSAIVNVSSGLAFVPFAISPIYSATRAAVHAYTQCLRAQLRATKVKVFELAPPSTDTPLNGAFVGDVDTSMMMKVDALAKATLRGIARDRYEITPGASVVLRFLGRFFPALGQRIMKKPLDLMLAGQS